MQALRIEHLQLKEVNSKLHDQINQQMLTIDQLNAKVSALHAEVSTKS